MPCTHFRTKVRDEIREAGGADELEIFVIGNRDVGDFLARDLREDAGNVGERHGRVAGQRL